MSNRFGFAATEWSYSASYPEPEPPNWWGNFVCSELAKAKYVARVTVTHTGLGVGSFFCETWGHSYYAMDLSLMRRTFAADPISPVQPQAAYYVMRNLATALENLQPDEFRCRVEGGPEGLLTFTLSQPGERIVALWVGGLAVDTCSGKPAGVVVEGVYDRVLGYDPLNGTQQKLRFEAGNNQTVVKNFLVKDYPLLLRFIVRKPLP